jgi:Glycosyl transferase family 2
MSSRRSESARLARAARLARRLPRVPGRLQAALDRQEQEWRELIALREEVAALRGEVAAGAAALGEVRGLLAGTQALAARAREAAEDWPGRVAAMRRAVDYERPWTEPAPLVTVTIATFNGGQILAERTLPSALRQAYGNFEVVVVGDACTDDTEERLAALGDPRIRFQNLPARGPYPEDPRARWLVAGVPAMNRALELARGSWIAPLDHDDEWDEDHLAVLVAEARRSRAELVYGRLRVRDGRNGRLLKAEIGEWPPRLGAFAFQAAVQHAGLARMPFALEAGLAGEPGDWNRTRRLWAAGVRFTYLDRPVATLWYEPRHSEMEDWLARVAALGYVDG